MDDIVLAQVATGDTAVLVEEGTAVELVEDHGGEAPGMPQLDFSTFPNQIFWLVLTLVAIYMILNRVALPRIGSVLAERQGTITNDIAAAEDLRKKAGDAEAAYDKALADARSEAHRIAQETRDEIRVDLDAAVARADEEIEARTADSEKEIAEIRDASDGNVREVAREAAAEIVRSLGMEPDEAAIGAAVDQRMEARA